MNSYNENLQASVLSSLSEQELSILKNKANFDASMFTLYYAEGARITAAEELQIANQNQALQQLILEQMTIDSDVSTNTLSSVNLSNQFITQTVSNTAVAAANVQIAANAILKLASDVGSIFSMVSAADFDTEIYDQSKYANTLMNGKNPESRGTAYLAEKSSQLGMEASATVAEIPSASLTSKAESTDASIKSLLEVVTKDYIAISEVVTADTEALAAANTTEKAAEGDLESKGSVLKSSVEAYRLSNRELNHNLRVKIPDQPGDATNYTVTFNRYRSPFKYQKTIPGVADENRETGYPVQDYYLFLVKNSSKEIFSTSDAEGLIVEPEDAKKYIKIKGTDAKKYSEQIYLSDLKDTDGDDMKLGERYVIFLFAVFDNSYKKIINTFDDYLSAPSAYFELKNRLSAPKPHDGTNITVKDNTLTFSVKEVSTYKVSYRCIFLPNNPDLVKGLLTVEGLQTVEDQTEALDEIFSKYNPEIERLEAEINTVSSKESGMEPQKSDNLAKQEEEGISDKEVKALQKEYKELEKVHITIQEELALLEAALAVVKKEKADAMSEIENPKHIKPGFFFNKTIADGLELDSYAVATIDSEKKGESETKYECSLEIDLTTTDNFGNSLIKGNSYIPVVLAVPHEEAAKQFISDLSDFQKTEDFKYEPELKE
ncbi:hypothetical protein [Tenacibaculum agarivorans]|uniref:hypothetical protein n=1 Tax=Tenacibaculum agarivorans TaxID=1908389 RepID=UPI00094B9E5E|nr:hypothetical protein [Tenacibaculum agarivorans]